MLPRAHRLRRPAEFDRAVRQGRRAASKTLVVHVTRNSPTPPRVGFVVSRAVGNAVQRNRLKRQLRHAAHSRLPRLEGLAVVIRANPSAGAATYAHLVRDLDRCLDRVSEHVR